MGGTHQAALMGEAVSSEVRNTASDNKAAVDPTTTSICSRAGLASSHRQVPGLPGGAGCRPRQEPTLVAALVGVDYIMKSACQQDACVAEVLVCWDKVHAR